TACLAMRAASWISAPLASSAVTAAANVHPAPLTRSWPILSVAYGGFLAVEEHVDRLVSRQFHPALDDHVLRAEGVDAPGGLGHIGHGVDPLHPGQGA